MINPPSDYESRANILNELRAAAAMQHDPNMAYALRGAADSLSLAIDTLATDATPTNLVDVNGLWAYSVRLLTVHRERPTPTSPTAGAAEDTLQQAMAA